MNLLQESAKLSELKNVLHVYNLVNTVELPMRSTKHTKSLIDVININDSNYTKLSVVMDLRFLDHYAQVLCIYIENLVRGLLKVRKGIFYEEGREELQYNLNKESWQDVFLESDVNGKFNVFMDTFHYYFDMVFPLTLFNQSRLHKKGWVTQGIKKYGKRMCCLNSLQKKINLTGEEQACIYRYRMIYKEAEKREKCILER
jgi:hypothetical protein